MADNDVPDWAREDPSPATDHVAQQPHVQHAQQQQPQQSSGPGAEVPSWAAEESSAQNVAVLASRPEPCEPAAVKAPRASPTPVSAANSRDQPTWARADAPQRADLNQPLLGDDGAPAHSQIRNGNGSSDDEACCTGQCWLRLSLALTLSLAGGGALLRALLAFVQPCPFSDDGGSSNVFSSGWRIFALICEGVLGVWLALLVGRRKMQLRNCGAAFAVLAALLTFVIMCIDAADDASRGDDCGAVDLPLYWVPLLDAVLVALWIASFFGFRGSCGSSASGQHATGAAPSSGTDSADFI